MHSSVRSLVGQHRGLVRCEVNRDNRPERGSTRKPRAQPWESGAKQNPSRPNGPRPVSDHCATLTPSRRMRRSGFVTALWASRDVSRRPVPGLRPGLSGFAALRPTVTPAEQHRSATHRSTTGVAPIKPASPATLESVQCCRAKTIHLKRHYVHMSAPGLCRALDRAEMQLKDCICAAATDASLRESCFCRGARGADYR